MAKRFAFDLKKAIEYSWDLIWKQNMRIRAEGRDFRGHSYFTTASDVENQVRDLANATAEGKPWPTEQTAYGRGYSRIRFSGDLQRAVRDWLFANPKITYHNFGKGHISGARFRPVGQPIGPAEQATIAKKEERRKNPRPIVYHYGHNGHATALAECVWERKKARGSFYSSGRSKAHCTSHEDRVTCKRCLNIINLRKKEKAE